MLLHTFIRNVTVKTTASRRTHVTRVYSRQSNNIAAKAGYVQLKSCAFTNGRMSNANAPLLLRYSCIQYIHI